MGAPIIDKTAISDLERELRREPTSMTLPSDAEFLAEALTELGIEEVVTVVGKLEPEKQRQVTNSLIARRHGLSRRVSRELVPYDKDKERALVRSLNSFKTQIYNYHQKFNFDKNQRQNLEILAEAGILDQTDAKIYLDTTRRIDQTLGKSSLRDIKNNHESFYKKQMKYSAISTGTGVIGVGAGIFSFPVAIPVGLGVLVGSFRWLLRSFRRVNDVIDKPGNDPNRMARYRRSLVNQLERHPTLSDDILTAIDYGAQLQEQLINPELITPKFDARMAEINVRIPQAQQYLQKSHQLYLKLQGFESGHL